MQIYKTINETKAFLNKARLDGKTIGFVPTMGALHQGHISLVDDARRDNDLVAVSVFVNPIQFNNKKDLETYPRNFEADAQKLKQAGVGLIFYPSQEEMYPVPDSTHYDFGDLEHVMEGRFRPGHFNGVAIVVHKLFEIIQPDKAYFGQKDFQQLAIIKALVRKEKMPVEIITCPIIREADGLAMSSRNRRLKTDERAEAPKIFHALQEANAKAGKVPVDELIQTLSKKLNNSKLMQLGYFEIVDAETLQAINNWNDSQNIVACTAVFVGEVRLIDNMMLF